MINGMRAEVLLSLLALVGHNTAATRSAAAETAAATAAAEPVRLTATAFGTRAEIEVRGLPSAEATAAAQAGLLEIFEVSQLLDPVGDFPGGLGVLNAAIGEGPQELDARTADVIKRGLQYCLWTNGAHGPLGADIYQLWTEPDQLPDPTELRTAVIGAQCNRVSLSLEETIYSVELGPDSHAAAIGMGRGYAIDRAVETLQEAGIENAWVEIGDVWRAIGEGPDGRGWLASLPPAPGETKPLDQVWLRDQALAMARIDLFGGESALRFIDQRTGVPARGVVAVIAVTETAMDAEALSAALFITGLREGHMRLGGLQPRPSVLWLLGEGKGTPVESTYRWSELDRIKRRRY